MEALLNAVQRDQENAATTLSVNNLFEPFVNNNTDPYLQIIDVSLVDGSKSSVLATYTSASLPYSTTMGTALADLPLQDEDSCRLYVCRDLEFTSDFTQHLCQVATPEFLLEYQNPVASRSLNELLSQCHSTTSHRWWQHDFYSLRLQDPSQKKWDTYVYQVERWKILIRMIRNHEGRTLGECGIDRVQPWSPMLTVA
jgi:hypothetical protein